MFTLLGILLISFPLLLSFAKGVEDIVMIRTIHGKNLREGDWLVSDVKVGKRQVKATFEGVSKEDMHLLRNTKKVQIKDGLPFVPAFLFGFILYHLYADVLIEQVIRIVVGG